MTSGSKRKSSASASSTGRSSRRSRSKSTMTPASEAPSRKRVKTEPIESPTKSRNTQTITTRLTDPRPRKEVPGTIYDDIVFVKVGPAEVKFGVHRGLLVKSSEFFRQVLNPNHGSNSKDMIIAHDGSSTVILLPTEDHDTFARVNSFFYSKIIRTPNEPWSNVTWTQLIKVYLFSVTKGIARLHNVCINATILKVKAGGIFPGQDIINMLWKTGVQATNLRRLLIKLFAVRCDLRSAVLSNRTFDHNFLNWLIIELYDIQKEGVKPENVDVYKIREEYYAHGSDNPIALD